MPVEVLIVTERRTMFDYISKPFRDVYMVPAGGSPKCLPPQKPPRRAPAKGSALLKEVPLLKGSALLKEVPPLKGSALLKEVPLLKELKEVPAKGVPLLKEYPC
jgi:hypothetical protein